MKHFGLSIFVFVFLISANVYAQKKKTTQAQPTATSQTEAVAPLPAEQTAVSTPDYHGKDNRLYRGASVRINGGYNMMQSGFSGKGANKTSPSTVGSTYGFDADYGMDSQPVNLYFGMQVYSVRHQDVPGTTPNAYNQKHTRTDIGFIAHEKANPGKGFASAGLGYFFEERYTDRINPAISAVQYVSGPVALIGYNDFFLKKFQYEGRLMLGFPNSFQEKDTITGQYQFGLSSTLSWTVIYTYTENVDLALGVAMKYDMINYSGTGSTTSNRGVTDASETMLNVSVPLELRFKF